MKPIQITLEEGLSKQELLNFLSEKYQVNQSSSQISIQKYELEEAKLLNTKQKQVLEYLSNGLKYMDIAEKMGMTVDGVRFYVKAIYKKFGVDNAIKAIKEYHKQKV